MTYKQVTHHQLHPLVLCLYTIHKCTQSMQSSIRIKPSSETQILKKSLFSTALTDFQLFIMYLLAIQYSVLNTLKQN